MVGREGMRIHDVFAERDLGIDFEPWVRVALLVDDPEPGESTWSGSAVQAKGEVAREAAWRLGVPNWLRIMHAAIGEATDIFPAKAIARARATVA